MNALDVAALYGVMPVISIPKATLAPPLAKALCDGGLNQIEITLRSDAAIESIRAIKGDMPEMLVGAGTVLTRAQADQAMAAGADFIVTPGFNPDVVAHCLDRGACVLPGCVTPTEIEQGLKYGLDTFKFFPAENLGGLATIKQLCGPYPMVKFVPTSGITMQNMAKYLSFDKVACVGGSFMAPRALVEAGDFPSITALTRQAVKNALGFSLCAVGVNGGGDAERMALRMSQIFDLPVHDAPESVVCGVEAEFSKGALPGKNGRIAIGTLSVPRAMRFLESRGVKLLDGHRHCDKNGAPDRVYLEEEIGGFAIYIVGRAGK